MTKRLGVIDLGTNTFHLLIVEPDEALGFREIYRERRFIKLAEGGIDRIGDPAIQRGVEALLDFKKQLDAHAVTNVRAIGTAALRTARNGQYFVNLVQETIGLTIELIDGDEEARLIHLGVARATPLGNEPALIMDIGGGSVEFIIADKRRVFWARSFPVGVAVLYDRFHRHEPISESEREALHHFLQEQLEPLRQALWQYPCKHLLGASGTFDVLEHMLVKKRSHPTHSRFPVSAYPPIARRLIAAPLEDRLAMADMPPARAEMIVVALLLLNAVLDLQAFEYVYVSSYALKEGVLSEML